MTSEYEVYPHAAVSLIDLLREYVFAGCTVAQLLIIFTPENNCTGIPVFAYVQPFKVAANAKGRVDPDIQLYRVVRDMRSDRTRKGLIVALTDIWRPVELIPVFGSNCNVTWNCDNAVENSKEFYLNTLENLPLFMEVY